MGILIIGLAIVLVISIGLAIKYLEELSHILIFCAAAALFFIFITASPGILSHEPTQYTYYAHISEGRIYFDDFSQSGNIITIKDYAAGGKTHWTDFKNYDVMNETLTIQLTDNLNRFEYKEIKTGKVFNKRIATQ